MAVAVGTAGVLPGAGTDAGVVTQGVVQQASPTTAQAADPLPAPTPGGPEVEATGWTTTPTAGSTSPRAAGVAPTTTSANLPAGAGGALPTSPAIPGCVADLIPTGGTPPDPDRLINELPACIVTVVTDHLPLDTIQSIIGSANLPVDISRCLSAVVSSLPGFSGGDVSGLSELLSSCMPTGFTGSGWDFGTGSGWDFGTGSTSGTESSFGTRSSGTTSSFSTSATWDGGSRRGSRSGR